MRQPEAARYRTAAASSRARQAGAGRCRAVPGTELRLVVTAPAVSRVLSLSGLDRLVPIHPPLPAATAAKEPGPDRAAGPGLDAAGYVITPFSWHELAADPGRAPPAEGSRVLAGGTPETAPESFSGISRR
jgi:hypothetical protein